MKEQGMIKLLPRAREAFKRDYIPRGTIAHNMVQWKRSIRYLGDKWQVLQFTERKDKRVS